jgi:ABC-type dipeptide/oligopeptide/nickel transport system permease component
MQNFLGKRLLLTLPALLGITLLVFVLTDAAPMDRAEAEVARAEVVAGPFAPATRTTMLRDLRRRYGLVDAATGERVALLQRYGEWLVDTATLRVGGAGDTPFRRRLWQVLPNTLLLGGAALLLALGIGVPLGTALGLRAGSRVDRGASAALFALLAVPEFLACTFLLLLFCGGWLDLFPSGGLRSDGADQWSLPARWLDRLWHLALPAAAMAVAPTVLIARFLRESVARAAAAPFALNLRAGGTEPQPLRARLRRAGLAPLATLAGSLLPMLVGGSVVVEAIFALDGIGSLAFHALLERDQPAIASFVLLTGVATLLALVVSDLLQRAIDPRVRLS